MLTFHATTLETSSIHFLVEVKMPTSLEAYTAFQQLFRFAYIRIDRISGQAVIFYDGQFGRTSADMNVENFDTPREAEFFAIRATLEFLANLDLDAALSAEV
jgi:hypothetical protein